MSDAQFDLIIAGGSVRAACQAAHAAGLRVAAIDLFADVDTSWYADEVIQLDRAGYPDNLLPALDRFDHSIPLMYTGGLENNPDLIQRINAKRPVWGNGSNTLRRVRDPILLQRALRRAGFPSLKTLSGQQTPATGIWMRKPLQSVGGIGIQKVRMPRTKESQSTDRIYWQKHLTGNQMSFAFFSTLFSPDKFNLSPRKISLQLLGTTESLPTDDFTYQGSLYRHHGMSRELSREVKRLGRFLQSHFQLTGFFGIDLIVNDRGIFVLEVNPRWTASMELLPQVMRLEGSRTPYSGKQIVYATCDMSVPIDWNWTSIDITSLADLPRPGTQIRSGDPVLTTKAHAATRTQIVKSLADSCREWEKKWK
jgi:Predicted ATP-dependent carboligase related to biotin carboxylase